MPATLKTTRSSLTPSIAGRTALNKLLDQELRKTLCVMPHHAVLLEQIVEQATDIGALQVLDIHAYRLRAKFAVASRYFRRDRLIAGNHPVDEFASRVGKDDAHVIGKGISIGLSRLSHQVGKVYPRGRRILNRFGNARNRPIRQYACVQRTGP